MTQLEIYHGASCTVTWRRARSLSLSPSSLSSSSLSPSSLSPSLSSSRDDKITEAAPGNRKHTHTDMRIPLYSFIPDAIEYVSSSDQFSVPVWCFTLTLKPHSKHVLSVTPHV